MFTTLHLNSNIEIHKLNELHNLVMKKVGFKF